MKDIHHIEGNSDLITSHAENSDGHVVMTEFSNDVSKLINIFLIAWKNTYKISTRVKQE